MRTKRITDNRVSQIRYPIPYNYKPKPIFLDKDPDMPTTFLGWVFAFVLAAIFVLLLCML